MGTVTRINTRSAWEAELAEVIGADALVALEAAYGGRYVYVHAQPSEAMTQAIGQEAAARLSQWYGASDIYVPRVTLRQIRNERIAEARNAGKPIDQIAATFCLSTKRIREILKEQHHAA